MEAVAFEFACRLTSDHSFRWKILPN